MCMLNSIRSSDKRVERKEWRMLRDEKKQKREDNKKKEVQRKDKLDKKDEMELEAEKKES